MKKSIVLAVLLTSAAFVSGAIAAAPPWDKFTGGIKSVDATAMSLVVAKGTESKIFWVEEATKITKSKTDLTFADLKAGMSVVVEYKKAGDKLIAVTIKVSTPKK
ncbi:MAG: hypothetical protein ACXU93_12680 [Thermodesulfobacteriota bacterium]